MNRDRRRTPVDADQNAAPRSADEARVAVTNNNSGRVTHDDLGNAIWEWAVTNGALTAESATRQLRRLDPKLSLAEDAPAPFDKVKRNPHGAVKGYSPYDSGVLEKTKTPRKKKDLGKLSEWLKLKKQAEKNKSGAG